MGGVGDQFAVGVSVMARSALAIVARNELGSDSNSLAGVAVHQILSRNSSLT